MEIHSLKPTATVQSINGAPCRAWVGKTATGFDVVVYVASVGTLDHEHDAAFLESLARAWAQPNCPEFKLTELDLRLATGLKVGPQESSFVGKTERRVDPDSGYCGRMGPQG